jgi:hypothetical protein
MKKLLFILLLCVLPISLQAQTGIKNIFKPVGKFLIHHTTLAIVDYAVSYLYVINNAHADAILFGHYVKGEKLYNVNPLAWHKYKNIANLALVIKGLCIGGELYNCTENKMVFKTFINRQLYLIPPMNQVWHGVWNRDRYGKWWDTSIQHNSSRYVIPTGSNDIKIALGGRQVDIANTVEIGIGIAGMFYVDPFWRW